MKLHEDVLKSLLINPVKDYKGKNFVANCPYCDQREFGISLGDNHLWQCLRKSKCGEVGNIYTLLKKLGRLELLSGNRQIIKYDQKLEDLITTKIENPEIDLLLETIEPPLGWKRIKSNFYLENRNFDSFDKYEVGITKLNLKLKDRVIFLVRENEEIKGFVSRLAKTKSELLQLESALGYRIPRYINSETDFSKLIGGIDEINEYTEEVILVEGILDKEGVERNLKINKESKQKCCCTFGAKLSIEQILKLQMKGIRNIILFFDLDVINKIKKHSLDLLNEFDRVMIAISSDIDKDPADLSEEETIETMHNLIDPINFYFNKVQVLKLK